MSKIRGGDEERTNKIIEALRGLRNMYAAARDMPVGYLVAFNNWLCQI